MVAERQERETGKGRGGKNEFVMPGEKGARGDIEVGRAGERENHKRLKGAAVEDRVGWGKNHGKNAAHGGGEIQKKPGARVRERGWGYGGSKKKGADDEITQKIQNTAGRDVNVGKRK